MPTRSLAAFHIKLNMRPFLGAQGLVFSGLDRFQGQSILKIKWGHLAFAWFAGANNYPFVSRIRSQLYKNSSLHLRACVNIRWLKFQQPWFDWSLARRIVCSFWDFSAPLALLSFRFDCWIRVYGPWGAKTLIQQSILNGGWDGHWPSLPTSLHLILFGLFLSQIDSDKQGGFGNRLGSRKYPALQRRKWIFSDLLGRPNPISV